MCWCTPSIRTPVCKNCPPEKQYAQNPKFVYQPHEQRVVDEKVELDKKIWALDSFIEVSPIFKTLPHDECDLLRAQLTLMKDYSSVLGKRIELFKGE